MWTFHAMFNLSACFSPIPTVPLIPAFTWHSARIIVVVSKRFFRNCVVYKVAPETAICHHLQKELETLKLYPASKNSMTVAGKSTFLQSCSVTCSVFTMVTNSLSPVLQSRKEVVVSHVLCSPWKRSRSRQSSTTGKNLNIVNSIKVAVNSFQYFPRLRFWWVIIPTLYIS